MASSINKNRKSYFLTLMGGAVSILFLQAPVAILLFQAPVAMAQGALEEIVVTAQRREQSLQDVPMAVEVFSGAELNKQGWRNLEALSEFSPSLQLDGDVVTQIITIRGFGEDNPSFTDDSAAPTFVDGIHFGRASQTKNAFMDVQSVEILKGPQPLYFGQNATAGAVNIRSRGPTDTLEGYVNVEVDSHNTQELTFGVGGPINDQWGYRVAGMYEDSAGYLTHQVTGQPESKYENLGGRVTLQFRPNHQLQLTGKLDASRTRADTHMALLCRTDGPVLFGRGGALDDPGVGTSGDGFANIGGSETVFIPPSEGGTAWGHPTTPLDQAPDCFSSNNAVPQSGPYFDPPDNTYARGIDAPGFDIRRPADAFTRTLPGGQGATDGFEDNDSVNAVFEVDYNFANGVNLQWLNGFSMFDRQYMRTNISVPFLENVSSRGEDYEQYSSELRITSAPGGTFEWSAGAFYQKSDLVVFNSNLRSNVRQMQRYDQPEEEADYRAVFGSITFNFMDDRASIDIGGRYQDDKKVTQTNAYSASWVFDTCPEDPCDPGLTLTDVVVDPTLGDYAGCEGRVDGDTYCLVDPSSVRFYGTEPSAGPFYAMPFRETRDTPRLWWQGPGLVPVGLTTPDYNYNAVFGEGNTNGNHYWETTNSEFSPQVSLRYRPTGNMMVYAKYAESVRIGGFDSGTNPIFPSRATETLAFDPEHSKQIEAGVKGTWLDGRLRYNLSLYEHKFPDQQVSITSPDPEDRSNVGNAAFRNRGIEFTTTFAATQDLTFDFGGVIMDGKITDLPGSGCTLVEISQGVADPNHPCKFYDDDTGVEVRPADVLAALDGDVLPLIDLSGTKMEGIPDWKFVLTADYERPLPFANDLELFANAKGYISDALHPREGIVNIDKTHGDLNLLVGVRNRDRGWSVTAFVRNLLEARPTYNAENDIVPGGIVEYESPSPSEWTSYGIKFEYLFGNAMF